VHIYCETAIVVRMNLSVTQAAARIGVSAQRVRALISDGQLPAERVGHQWVVNDTVLARHEARAGRPLSERSAWNLLNLASGTDQSQLTPSDRRRARQRLDILVKSPMPEKQLRAWLPRRGRRQVFRAPSADISDLRGAPQLLVSGVSHPRSGIAAPEVAEGYANEDGVAELAREFLLVASEDHLGNVIIHVPSRSVVEVSLLLLAADLAEHGGPREDGRAAELVRSLR
jgi:excisionase family DNA binding protein